MAQRYLNNIYTAVLRQLDKTKILNKRSEFCATLSNKEDKDRASQPLIVPEYSMKDPITSETSYVKLPVTLPVCFSSLLNRTILSDGFKQAKSSLLTPFIAYDSRDKKKINYSIEYSDKGMIIELDMKDYKQEDISVRVEGAWLVVEGNMTTAVPEKEGGGLMIRNVMRRYEIPPNSDVSNIKMKFKDSQLHITVPALIPTIKKE